MINANKYKLVINNKQTDPGTPSESGRSSNRSEDGHRRSERVAQIGEIPLVGRPAPISTIAAAVDRFENGELGKLFLLKPFNSTEFEVKGKRLYERWEYPERYRVTNGNKIAIAGENTLVINSCATLNNNFFSGGTAGQSSLYGMKKCGVTLSGRGT